MPAFLDLTETEEAALSLFADQPGGGGWSLWVAGCGWESLRFDLGWGECDWEGVWRVRLRVCGGVWYVSGHVRAGVDRD